MRRIVAPMSPLFAIDESAARQVIENLKSLDFSKAFEDAKVETAAYNDDRQAGKRPYQTQGSTALIPIVGPMSKYFTCASLFLGGTATSEVLFALRQAVADPNVESIVMVIDSPGGEVSGTEALANGVFDARQSKKVVAVIEDKACSAAYWVASQASEVVCNATACVGNIGAVLVVPDLSKAAAQAGVKVNVVKSGPYKGIGAEGAEVTDDEIAHLQSLVDDYHSQFVSNVARGRGISLDAVNAVATGEAFIGQKAVDAGLVDRIGSLEDALLSLQPKGGTGSYGVAAAENLGEPSTMTEQEQMGFIEKIVARLTGHSASQAAKGGDGGHDEETAALKARIDQMQTENAARAAAEGQKQAEAFVTTRVAAGLIEPAEAEQAKADFLAAWKADGNLGGEMVASITRAYDGRQPNLMTLKSQIGEEATKTLAGDGKDESAAAVAYANATALGKKALEAIANQ